MNETLARYFSGNASNEEQEEVLKWREENPDEFLSHKKVWAASGTYKPPLGGLSAIIGEIEDEKPNQSSENVSSTSWMRYAAAIAVAVGLGAVAMFVFNSGNNTDLTQTISLSDGTEVMLYKDAELKEISFGDNERVVSVKGLAYFDVERDEDRPFIIYTEQAKVEVLGTSFTVDTESAQSTEVIVESGLVSFSQNPDTYHGQVTSIKLSKGEKGLIKPQAKGIIKQNNRNLNYLAWANQELTFKHSKMSDVADLIGEVYGYEVTFENSAISSCKLTAKYQKKSPKQLAKLISETFGFSYQLQGKSITFSGQGCQ